MASRHCACGEELEEDGHRLRCSRCGSRATAWAVRLEGGEIAGAGNGAEALILPGLLREGLGIRQEILDRAASEDFCPPGGAARRAKG